MRCPKCGYISFDHLEVCLKCKKDIKATAEELQGGVLQVAPPSFLNIQSEEDSQDDQSIEQDIFADDDAAVVDDVGEYVDPDLEILLEDEADTQVQERPEDTNEITLEMDDEDSSDLEISMDDDQDDDQDDEIAIDFSEDDEISIDLGQDEDELTIDFSQDEEDDGEITVDLSQFDDALVGDESKAEQEGDDDEDSLFDLEMPAELTDMSDLAPPAASGKTEQSVTDSMDDLDSLDMNLDGLGYNLESETSGQDKPDESVDDGELVLSLDDIDFSDTIAEPEKSKSGKSGGMGMDEDLSFDLDLGGLSIHDDV